MKHPYRTALQLLACASVIGLMGWAQAQTVYRIVGPDGKVTFSDKPPSDSAQGKVTGSGTASAGPAASGGASTAGLPLELRQAMGKYPVTLYTGPQCDPCDAGRAVLNKRGIPFAERTINTPADFEHLQKVATSNSLPVLAVGGQRIKGFQEAEWNGYLDAAGYPSNSVLPKGYKNPPPSPAVPLKAKEEEKPNPAASSETRPAPAPAPSNRPNTNNPTGIVF